MVHAPGEGAVCRHRPRQRDGRPRARVRPAVDTRLDSDEANRATTTAKLLDMEFLSISPDGDVRPPLPRRRRSARSEPAARDVAVNARDA